MGVRCGRRVIKSVIKEQNSLHIHCSNQIDPWESASLCAHPSSRRELVYFELVLESQVSTSAMWLEILHFCHDVNLWPIVFLSLLLNERMAWKRVTRATESSIGGLITQKCFQAKENSRGWYAGNSTVQRSLALFTSTLVRPVKFSISSSSSVFRRLGCTKAWLN